APEPRQDLVAQTLRVVERADVVRDAQDPVTRAERVDRPAERVGLDVGDDHPHPGGEEPRREGAADAAGAAGDQAHLAGRARHPVVGHAHVATSGSSGRLPTTDTGARGPVVDYARRSMQGEAMKVPLTIADHLDRAELVYRDRVVLVDEPDQPAA